MFYLQIMVVDTELMDYKTLILKGEEKEKEKKKKETHLGVGCRGVKG